MSAAASLVVIGDVESFAVPMTIAHDGEYVQVTIAPRFAPSVTYARQFRGRLCMTSAEVCAHVARHIEETAALVSTPALVAWLLDCGFAPLT